MILFCLNKHLTQGQTMHHFLLVQLDSDRKDKVKLNLPPAEIQQKYGGNIEPEMNENTTQLMLRLFNGLGRIDKIVKPSDFKSAVDYRSSAIACSIKASSGLLYPMK